MNKIFAGIAVLLIFCVALSCKTLKAVKSNKGKSSIERIYDSLVISNPKYRSLEIKCNIDYETSKQSMNLKGSIKLYKDSIIWVSLSPGLGIEGVRFMCNKDSIFILNRLDKTLTKGTYDYIKKNWNLDIDFTNLQSMLCSEIFIYPSATDPRSKFVSEYQIKNDSSGLEVYRKSADNIENLLKIERDIYKVISYLINDISEQRSLTLDYNFDKMSEPKNFPDKFSIKSNNKGNFLNITIDYNKISVDTNPEISFKIPSNYSVISH